MCFCPEFRSEYPNILNNLDMDAFKRLIKDLVTINYDGRFSFTGFCEPLTKNLHDYVLEIKKTYQIQR